MATHNLGQITKAANLKDEDAAALRELTKVYANYRGRNALLSKYYDGKIKAAEVNIGIAVPQQLENLEISCEWPAIVVEALQARSIFDAFWSKDGSIKAEFDQIIDENDLILRYPRAVIPELKHGTVFGTLSMTDDDVAAIKFHTVQSSAARWDGEHDRVLDGFAIIDSAKFNGDRSYKPSLVNMYTDTDIITLRRYDATHWEAEYHPHKMGRPLMVAMSYRPTDEKPFGKSRISPAVMHLTDAYLREMLRLEVGAELFTSPQKYLIGGDDSLTDEFAGNFKAYITNLITFGRSGESGEVPEFGQLAASSMQPHIEVMRCLAANLSGATSVPVSELGVIHDNPSSAEAIYAAKESLVIEAENLNKSNGKALKEIALMAYAMNEDIGWDEIPYNVREIVPHFKSAAMPSVVSQADAMVKIAAVDEGFAGTRVFYSQVGFDDALIGQIESERKVGQSASLLKAAFDRMNNGTDDTQGA